MHSRPFQDFCISHRLMFVGMGHIWASKHIFGGSIALHHGVSVAFLLLGASRYGRSGRQEYMERRSGYLDMCTIFNKGAGVLFRSLFSFSVWGWALGFGVKNSG